MKTWIIGPSFGLPSSVFRLGGKTLINLNGLRGGEELWFWLKFLSLLSSSNKHQMAKKSTSPFVPGVGGTHASKVLQSLSSSPSNLSRWVQVIGQVKTKYSHNELWHYMFLIVTPFVSRSTVEEYWRPQIQPRPLLHSHFRGSRPPWLLPCLLSPMQWPPSHSNPPTAPRRTVSSTWRTLVSLHVWIVSDLKNQTCTEERTPSWHLYCTISDAWRDDAKSTARYMWKKSKMNRKMVAWVTSP